MKKYILLCGIIIGIGSVIFVAIFAYRNNGTQTTYGSLQEGTSCYAYQQAATANAPYAVDEMLTIEVNDGLVMGTKRGTQMGPDMTNGYTGTITGTLDQGMITAVFAYTIEGSNNREQELYRSVDAGFEKLRYPLVEKNGMLVPDRSKEFKILSYKNIDCRDESSNTETLGTRYITSQGQWPPRVFFERGEWLCLQSGNVVMEGGITTEKNIGGRKYCITLTSEGAAGSTYTTYMYKTIDRNRVATVSFVLRFVQCMNYDMPQQSECLSERAMFDPDSIVDRLVRNALF